MRQKTGKVAEQSVSLNKSSYLELLFVSLVSFGLALIQLKLKFHYTPAWFDGTLANNHRQLLDFQYTNNEQSRLLQFYLPEVIRWITGASVPGAYALQRVLFATLTFVAFHRFLRKWFDPLQSLAGMALLAAITPMTMFTDLQESSNLLMLTFVLALWMLRERRYTLLTAVLYVGALNNETILVLAVSVFFCELAGRSLAHLTRAAGVSLLTLTPALLATGVIRFITRDRPHLGGADHRGDNWDGIVSALSKPMWAWPFELYLGWFFLFSALWVYAFIGLKKQPDFLRKASACVPFFLIAHLLTGKILENRQMLPLAVLLIPMSLWTFQRQATETSAA